MLHVFLLDTWLPIVIWNLEKDSILNIILLFHFGTAECNFIKRLAKFKIGVQYEHLLGSGVPIEVKQDVGLGICQFAVFGLEIFEKRCQGPKFEVLQGQRRKFGFGCYDLVSWRLLIWFDEFRRLDDDISTSSELQFQWRLLIHGKYTLGKMKVFKLWFWNQYLFPWWLDSA